MPLREVLLLFLQKSQYFVKELIIEYDTMIFRSIKVTLRNITKEFVKQNIYIQDIIHVNIN